MAIKPVLLGPDGQPIQRELLPREIGGATITGLRSPLSGYPGDGLNPWRLATLLREADQGDPVRYFELAEQIEERDLHYAGVLGTRKRSVAQLEITVEAASDDAAHVRQADMVRDWLARDELQDELFDVLDAIGKGVSFTEIIWDSSEGQHVPARLEWRDPRWFVFDRVDGRTPLLRVDPATDDWARAGVGAGTGRPDAAPLPAFKFICATVKAKSGLPVRGGIARLATWSWMFKAFTLRDWAIFAQTFGQPIRLGKYESGATGDDKDTLFRAVANIAGDCAAIVPASMHIEFVESKNVGQGHQLYKERADWLDQQISKAVLGQTTSTDAISGGHAVSQEHRQVQEDIERADARTLAAILNRDLVRPFVNLNHGPQQKYPSLRIGRADERDVAQTLSGIEKLLPLGLKVEEAWARDMLGIPEPDAGAVLLTPPAPPPDPFAGLAGLRSAERDPPVPGQDQRDRRTLNAALAHRISDRVDAIADAAEDVVAPGADALIDAVREVVDAATSLDDLRDRILALKPDMPTAQLAELLRLALVMGELEGRADVRSHERQTRLEERRGDLALNYDPGQPRDPAGSPTGGQWSSSGGGHVARLKAAGTDRGKFDQAYAALTGDTALKKADIKKIAEDYTGLLIGNVSRQKMLARVHESFLRRARFENKIADDGTKTVSKTEPKGGIRDGIAATRDWLRGKTARDVIAEVAGNHKLRESALSLTLQGLVNHATGLDASTWQLSEDAIDYTVGHFADIAAISKLKAKAVLGDAVRALIGTRRGAALNSEETPERDQVLELLLALLDAIEALPVDDDEDDDA